MIYVIKTARGQSVLSFDREERAREVMAERARKGIKLTLWRVHTVEEQVA